MHRSFNAMHWPGNATLLHGRGALRNPWLLWSRLLRQNKGACDAATPRSGKIIGVG